MSVEAGAVHVRMGGDMDEAAFKRWDQAVEKAERKAKAAKIEADLGADFDSSAFDAYDKALDEAAKKTQRRDAYKAALGGEFDSRAFNKMEREMAKARALAAKDVTAHLNADVRGFDRFKRALKDTDGPLGGFTKKMRDANTATTFFSRAISLLKWPALLAAAGMATAAIGALLAGVGALTGALAPLTGALAAFPALGSAFVQASSVMKLATVGLSDAVGGLGEKLDESSDAFKQLSPEAQRFARTLNGLKPEIRGLQQTAQRGFFPGAETGLRSLMRNLPAVEKMVAGTSRVLGTLAERAGRQFGSAAWGRDLVTQGERNEKTIARMGVAGLNLSDALRHVTLAAGPLVDWMGKLAVGWSQNIEGAAKTGRETGKLQKFFEKTRSTMERLGSMTGHFASALGQIGKAGAPLGRTILKDLDKAAGRFEDWTKSASGKNQIADYFRAVKAPLYATAGLIGDVVKMFFRLSAAPEGRSGFLQMVRSIRQDLLPVLEDVIQSTTAAFGPALIDLLTNVARLLGQLAGSSGPLTLFVRLLSKAAGALAGLLEHNPALKGMVVSIAGLAAVAKTVSFLAWISGLKTVIGLWKGVRTAAAGAAVAQGAAGVAGAGGAAAGGRGAAAIMAGSSMFGGAAQTTAAATGLRGLVSRLGPIAKRAGFIGLGLSLISGITDAFSDRNRGKKLGDRMQNFLNAATAGIVPAAGPDIAEKFTNNLTRSINEKLGRLRTMKDPAGIEKLQRDIANAKLKFPDGPIRRQLEALERKADQTGKSVERDLDMRRATTLINANFQSLNRISGGTLRDFRAVVKTNMGGIRILMDENSEAGGRAMRVHFRQATRTLKSLLRGGSIDTKTYMREIRRLATTHSEGSRENIGKNFRGAVRAIRGAMRSGEVATDDGMKAIRRLMLEGLKMYGFSGSEARKLFRAGVDAQDVAGGKDIGDALGEGPQGLPGNARGGRIRRAVGGFIGTPGRAGMDNIEMAAPQDSSVINRHQLPALDLALQAAGLGGVGGLLSRSMGGGSAGPMVPFVAGEGELLLDPNQSRLADVALQTSGLRGGLDDLFAAIPTPHWASRGAHLLRRAGGGSIVPVPGFPGESAAQSILDEIAFTVKNFGVVLTDAYGPGHTSAGHTQYGTSADFGGSDEAMDRAAAYWARKGYEVGYDGRFGTQAWSGHGPSYVAGGNAHVHVTFGGGTGVQRGGAGGLGAPARPWKNIKRVRVGGPDSPLKSMAQAALDTVRAGANKRGRAIVAGLGGGAGGADYSGINGDNRTMGRLMAERFRSGWGRGPQWRALDHLWGVDEGSWDENLANYAGSGAYGIAQALPSSKYPPEGQPSAPPGRKKAMAQIAWGLNYIATRPAYGDPISAHNFRHRMGWYAKGGKLARFAGGGRVTGAPWKPSDGPVTFGGQRFGPGILGPGANKLSDRIKQAMKGLGSAQEWGLAPVEAALAAKQDAYDYEERRFEVEVGDEEFVIPAKFDNDGKLISGPEIDRAALDRKAGSLGKLVQLRKDMHQIVDAAMAQIRETVRKLNDAIGRLRKARAAAKSKDKPAYNRLIKQYLGSVKGLKGTAQALKTMRRDAALDITEISNEAASLGTGAAPGSGVTAAYDEAVAGLPTAETDGGDGGGGESDSGDSAAEIAAQARQMFEAFTANRTSLFSGFGSNFYTGPPGLDPGIVAAGLRQFGAFGQAAGGAGGGGYDPAGLSGGSDRPAVQVTNNYAAPPPDPHTYTAALRHEIRAQL